MPNYMVDWDDACRHGRFCPVFEVCSEKQVCREPAFSCERHVAPKTVVQFAPEFTDGDPVPIIESDPNARPRFPNYEENCIRGACPMYADCQEEDKCIWGLAAYGDEWAIAKCVAFAKEGEMSDMTKSPEPIVPRYSGAEQMQSFDKDFDTSAVREKYKSPEPIVPRYYKTTAVHDTYNSGDNETLEEWQKGGTAGSITYGGATMTEGTTDTGNPKDAYGDRKTQFGLVPMPKSVAYVMTLGAKKYGAYNFRTAKIRNMVYAHAILRHLRAWMDGQDNDPESGESHMAHVASCALIHEDSREHDNIIEERTWVEKVDPNAEHGPENDRFF